MAKKTCTRRELLDRWRVIDEEDESMWSDPSKQSHVRQLKEKWFSDTFSFLICLQKDTHIWCGSWDLMGPLLETFYNYFKDERDDSPLKILWGRISQEMRQCTQCICQHHQAQEMYNAEYEASCVGPLLKVLRILDEERVTQHLKDINARIARGEMGSKGYNAEVVSVMFEVLMFPVLLEDQSLVTEFQSFIEAVDDTHELTLAGHQQYPGVYALLFLKSRRVRAIGLRLAGFNGKLRRAADLEPLQPLLKKFIGYLETEVLPSALETSRPRVQLDRITVWLGIKALLGFLEPLAFEEGILERYPIFLSIVLNHVSDDSLEFTHAVNCLRLLFEMLGCKLWLRTTLSPGVMRNTLLGQCFHTRNERSHKEIFDLFQPFLQSLEALQDGEHEKQRRHFLYFLLHQVKMSSNFSVLMRKKACQIALFIIHRGYKMNPPCPPFECAHMWGPSLVYSLRDSSLHDSLRQPAFDLIHTIIVSDSAALIISLMKLYTHESPEGRMGFDFKDDEDELMFSHDIEEKDSSCWNEFGVQNKLTSLECNGWMCIPMLWFEVLIETNISVFPISFFKAVFWALSRLSMVELESSKDLELPVRDWISSYAEKISFVWEIPTGSDDGGDGKLSKNSIDASSMCIPLVKTFKRLTAQFVIQMEVAERWTQWTWEPRMSESLILLLVDPNDNVRQVDRLVLEHVSKTRGLASGLKFLCSCGSSLFAIYLGLKHAMTLVQLDFIMSNFHRLHHLFFVVGKLLKEAVESSQKRPGCEGDRSQFSSQGGFLRQPVFSDLLIDLTELDMVDPESWKKFIRSVSEVSWPSLIKCLARGKGFINDKNSQMTCVRLLEILPVVFEGLCSPLYKLSGMEICVADLKWLLDLVDWGKSSQSTVTRYWKQSLTVLLDLLKRIPHQGSSGVLMAAEMLISSDDVAVDTLKEHLSQLSVSLSKEVVGIPKAKDCFEFNRKGVAFNKEGPFLEKAEVVVLDSPAIVKSKSMDRVVILSDDEEEEKLSSIMTDLSCNKALGSLLKGSTVDSSDDKGISIDEHDGKSVSVVSTLKKLPEVDQFVGRAENSRILSQKEKYDASKGQVQPVYPDQSKSVIDTREEVKNICTTEKGPQSQHNDHTFRKGSSDRAVCLKNTQQSPTLETSGASSNPVKTDTTLKESVPDTENDPWERALNAARYQQSSQTKSGPSVPKRKIIQLNVPGDNRSGYIRKLDAGGRRLKPPRLDDWYKPILELDYFSAVGLSSSNEDENANATKLQEVPVCFESPEHYVDIFRPLVLEEFKAQLHSSFMEASSAEEMCCGSISVLSVERVDDFHHIRCIPSDNGSAASRCFENDLVLLTKNPLQNSAHEIHMIGKVERREKDNRRSCIIVIRFYFQNGSLRLNKAKRFLTERSKWYINRIMSITPQLREFQALSSLKDIPILPIILNPTIRPSGDHEFSEIALRKLSQPLQHAFKSSFNDSQLQAISSSIRALSRSEFELSLIQGPPGTGKTRTILAIVSGLLAVSSEQKNYADKKQNNNLRQSNTSSNNSRPKISQSAAIARAWQDAAFARQLTDDGESRSESVNNSTRVRVLICAQSNAAVDELVSRISTEGLYGCDGKSFKPYLVRVGNAKTLHPASLPFFIDTLVDQRLTEEKMNDCDKRNDLSGDNPVVLRSNLEKLVDLIRKCEAKRASIRDGHTDPKCLPGDGTVKEDDDKDVSDADVSAKLNRLYEQKREICKDLAVAQARERKTSEESKALRSKLRKTILREAEIVVTTLSGAGGDLYGVCSESFSNYKFGSSSENTLFDAVVIDEAAQALEPATLIPLQLLKSSRTKCIMVGDPKQLPATVLSHVASKFLYECSMFERLQRAGHPVVMLSKQYRMHPEICKFPSLHFYDSKLLNGDQMASKVAPFHANKYLGPYMFFDVIDGQESHGKNSGAMSLCNDSEASVAIEVLRLFSKRYPSEFVGGRIGIISPYKSQVSLLRSRFSNVFGSSVTADVEFNTVDGFQGREVDILILSTVRASDQGSGNGGKSSMIGFVADVRRMNVALTRAKLSLWIVGNAKTLRTNQNWAALIKNAKERNLVKTMARPYASKFTKSSSASRQESFVGSYSKHVKLDEKVKDTSKGLNQPKGHAKEKNGRKSEVVSNDGSSPSCMPNTDGNHNTSVNRDDPPDVPSEDRKPSIEVQNAPNNRGKGRDVGKTLDKFSGAVHAGKSKILGEKSNHDTNEALLQNQIDSSRSAKNLSTLKGAGECSEHNTGESKPGISHSSTGNHHQDSELKDGSQIMNMKNAPKDLITARKRQRDAVAALLPSGLLSSKKSETASKSKTVKRPPSPTATASTKRPRPGEDTSATVLQDTSTLPAHQQARPPKIKRPVSKHQRNC